MKHENNCMVKSVKNSERMKSIFRELKESAFMDEKYRDELWNELYSLLEAQTKAVVGGYYSRNSDFADFVREVTQMASIGVFRYMDKYDEALGEVNTWTNSIIMRAYKKVLKESTKSRYEREKLLSMIKVDDDGEEYNLVDEYISAESPEDTIIHNDRCQEIMDVVYSLSPNRKRALLLSLEGYSPSEIKDIMGLKDADAAYRHLYRARMDVDRKLGLNIYTKDRSREQERDI